MSLPGETVGTWQSPPAYDPDSHFRQMLEDRREAARARLGKNPSELLQGMAEVALTNDEEKIAEFFTDAAYRLMEQEDLTVDDAALQVLDEGLAFLRRFSDCMNKDIPRRLFPGLVLGVLRLHPRGIAGALRKIVAVEKNGPFMWVLSQDECEAIQKLTREWTVKHPEAARAIAKIARSRGLANLTPISGAIATTMDPTLE